MELKDFEYNFIDEIYNYEGLWGRKSKCGLKVVNNLIIATDIYSGNPGGSITEYCAELAMILCNEYKIDFKDMQFVHHTPEVNSSLDFFEEVFYQVDFDIKTDEIKAPDWNAIPRSEFVQMVNKLSS